MSTGPSLRWRVWPRLLVVLLVEGGLVGCGAEAAKDYGKALFNDPSVSSADSNSFRCATCHELSPQRTVPYPGYTLYDATTRPSYWGGFETTFLDASNQCVAGFMRGKALTETDEKMRALYVYLQTLSPDPSPQALSLTVVQNIVDVPSGDAGMGKQLYDQVCANCHGSPHTGAGRISTLASVIPDETLMMHGTDPKTGARPVAIEKVRHGRFFMVGGNMPLFSLEALSDDQLGAILAYLEQFGLPKYSM
jgi:thiosulfate dehydrogenase